MWAKFAHGIPPGFPDFIFFYSVFFVFFTQFLFSDLIIVIVTGFSDSSHYMAHNRESALIDYIGLQNLTNIYNGSRFGDFTDFSSIKSKNYGMLALYVLFKNYVYNGATAFTFEDLCFQKTERSSDINGNNCEHKCLSCSTTMNCLFIFFGSTTMNC